MYITPSDTKYGIVIDSGSSGSRIQIYKWEDPKTSIENSDQETLQSPPKITQQEDWTFKIKPGISTFGDKIDHIWDHHYKELIEFAETIVPVESQKDTPVFVLSTAGMRLLPDKKRDAVLKETCRSIKKNSKFYIPNCKNFVETIDGETEGLYGWLGLNYMMGQFNNYKSEDTVHESIGFMDMGGASNQIAFVPSSQEDIDKHSEDLSTVTLRNVNGETQSWRVFVETWLGFGANEARKRYLNQLINNNIYAPNRKSFTISDPCLPKGAEIKHSYQSNEYKIKGVGNYQQCMKSIYPLLLKNIPCKDEPCLFNGIHGPRLNFEKDKFIGISEYWYTANDIFQSGGEYNFHAFNNKVKEFCESSWDTIIKNSEAGQYSNLDPDVFLKDACFKASWVMNVLHEGFDLPRLEVDEIPEQDEESKKLTEELPKKHVPFMSANSVNGGELSWTLGKILLFASSQIKPQNDQDSHVGISPSELSGAEFIPGGGSQRFGSVVDYKDEENEADPSVIMVPFIFIIFILALYFFKKKKINFPSISLRKAPLALREFTSKIPYINKISGYSSLREQEERINSLEAGLHNQNEGNSTNNTSQPYPLSVLRTRSSANLTNNNNEVDSFPKVSNFLNKPFTVPKRAVPQNFYSASNNNSKESISRAVSSNSLRKSAFD